MGVGARDCLFLTVVLGGTGILGAGLVRMSAAPPAQPSNQRKLAPDLSSTVFQVDASFRERWASRKLMPAALASDLAVMRRLALALCGTVPSLEEIRHFETRPRQGRVETWLDELLVDRRCADYLAERFARAYVGTEDGPFVLYRRRRFVTWLSDAFMENRPYNVLVPRTHRLAGALDGSSGDQLRVSYLRSGRGPADSRSSGRAGGAGVPRARIDCAMPRSSVSALETGRFSEPGGVFRWRPFRSSGYTRRRK